jgi:hypothetical protein
MREPDYKKNARIIGILYIIGTAAGILSVPFISIKNSPDYLIEIAGNPNMPIIGAILILVMGFALAMIPAFAFPVLRKYNDVLGVGYIIFRSALETCTYIIQAVCLLALSLLGTAYAAGIQETVFLLGAGTSLKAIIDSSVTAFVFSVGALVFYSALYKYRLIPGWLSGIGIIGALLHLVSGVLVLFGMQEHFDKGSLIMNFPIAVQEMVMAVWLIIKGFHITETKQCSER